MINNQSYLMEWRETNTKRSYSAIYSLARTANTWPIPWSILEAALLSSWTAGKEKSMKTFRQAHAYSARIASDSPMERQEMENGSWFWMERKARNMKG